MAGVDILKFIFFLPLMLSITLFGCRKNLEENKKYEKYIGRQIEIKKDVFVYLSTHTYEWNIAKPGSSGQVPPSIEIFKQYPKRWMWTGEYLKGAQHPDCYKRGEGIMIVPAGTVVTISKIERSDAGLAVFVHTFVQIKGADQEILLKLTGQDSYTGYPTPIYDNEWIQLLPKNAGGEN